jgi:hypothetical protein
MGVIRSLEEMQKIFARNNALTKKQIRYYSDHFAGNGVLRTVVAKAGK